MALRKHDETLEGEDMMCPLGRTFFVPAEPSSRLLVRRMWRSSPERVL
jgi:hypothetical protein